MDIKILIKILLFNYSLFEYISHSLQNLNYFYEYIKLKEIIVGSTCIRTTNIFFLPVVKKSLTVDRHQDRFSFRVGPTFPVFSNIQEPNGKSLRSTKVCSHHS